METDLKNAKVEKLFSFIKATGLIILVVFFELILFNKLIDSKTVIQNDLTRFEQTVDTPTPQRSISDCGNISNWTVLSSNGGLLPSGNYYLDGDTTLVSNIMISSGVINIDLNGNILLGALNSDESIFTVTGGTLNIYDCDTSNKVHNYKIKEVYSNASQDIYYNNLNYSNKLFQRYYDFNDIGDGVIVGGIITGGHKYSTKTDIKSNFTYEGGGSAFLIGGSSGIVNFYGGTISGNTTTALTIVNSVKSERSGAVGVRQGGTFNFYDGQITGNSSRYPGAGIYVSGQDASTPARANLYGGIISDNYSLDTIYNQNQVSMQGYAGGGLSTDNIVNASSIISISGAPKIINNQSYDFASNSFIKANMTYSTLAVNAIHILGKLYVENNGSKTYASIGLWGGEANQLTTNYTVSGNTPEDVNKVFFSDVTTRAVGYNSLNGELKYIISNNITLTYHANNGTSSTSTVSLIDKISISDSLFNKTGHNFLHWNTKADDSGTVYLPNDTITISTNQTLYAIWIKASYRIHYWLNGGTFDTQINSTYTYGESMTLPTPIWDGKVFEGWYNNAMLTGNAVTQTDLTSFGDKTYYAKWAGVNVYTITSTAGSNGTINPLGSIIYDGTSQNYQIEPTKGYKVATFTVDGVDKKLDIINNVHVVAGITSNMNINVTFEKILPTDLTVYATRGENGNISPKYYSVVSNGSNLTYTFTPNPGFRMLDVIVNGKSVGAVSTYTFNNITSTQTIHAEFISINYHIKYNLNGGAFIEGFIAPTYYVEGDNFALPSASETKKTYYTFNGWFDNANLEGTAISNITTSDLGTKEYWSKWVVNQYTITFDSLGGSAVDSITQDYNTSVSEPIVPTRSGYSFGGWFTDMGFTKPFTFATMPGNNITLYAKWNLITYYIFYNVHVSHMPTTWYPTSYDVNTAITWLPTPWNTGYTFDGWYETPDFSSSKITKIPLGSFGNIALYAKFIPIVYKATYYLDGGTNYGGNPDTFTVEDFPVSFLQPTKLGYTFNGWYDSYYFTNKVPIIGTDNINNVINWDNTVVLYAKWTIAKFRIIFDTNSPYSFISNLIQDYNTRVYAPQNPTKTGCTFAGWYEDRDLTIPYVFTTMPAENITVYAKWNPNPLPITYYLDGGTNSLNNPTTYNVETPTITLENPTKPGYTFLGWYENPYFNTPQIITIPTGTYKTMNLYAKWAINKYTITFDSKGGSSVASIAQVPNSKVTTPTAPTKNGYTFDGWYTDSDLTTTYTFTTMPEQNFTLYAKWNRADYTISYNLNSGINHSSNPTTYHVETSTITLEIPTRLGYTFYGWYAYSNFSGSQITAIPLGSYGNKVFYARWLPTEYTITYYLDGGTNYAYNPATYNIEKATFSLAWPTKNGYAFNGWYENSDFSGSPLTQIPLGSSGNKVLYAKWTKLAFKITYNLDGGTNHLSNPTTYNVDTLPITFESPTRLGYTFVGWYNSGNAKITTLIAGNSGDKVFTARWTINKYTITFDSKGGSIVDSITQDYNTSVSAPITPTAPENSDYFFGGWYIDSGLTIPYTFTTMPAENITLYAYWTENLIEGISADNINAIYDGNSHYIDVKGTVSGDVVSYKIAGDYSTSNPTFIDVTDTVTVYYKVTRENYADYVGSATVTIAAANLSDVSITGYNGIYDGKAHEAIVTKSSTVINNQSLTWQYKTSLEDEYLSSIPSFTDAGVNTIYYKVSAPNHNDFLGGFTSIISPKNIIGATITLGPTLTYNGNEQTQSVTSVTVDDLAVTYDLSGNKATNYNLNGYHLIISGNGNFTGEISETWNIEKINYDMSGITFESNSVTYDGNSHSLVISGTLPTDLDNIMVTVSYRGSATNVSDGLVTVTAIFATESVNYNVPEAKTATISIIPTTITNNGAFTNYSGEYDGKSHSIGYDESKLEVVNNQTVTIKYSTDNVNWTDEVTYKNFTNGVKTVYYKISALNHSDLTGSSTINITPKPIVVTADSKSSKHHENLVELTYTLSFALYDGDSFTGVLETNADKNSIGGYNITQGTLSAGDSYSITFIGAKYFVTEKESISINQIGQNVIYNGTSQSYPVTGTNLTGFRVEYFVNGLYTEIAPTNVGNYKVKVTRAEVGDYYAFSVEIVDGLVIEKATYDISGITLNDKTVKADGTPQSITIDGALPLGVTVSYENNGKIEAGIYIVTAKFAGDTINYHPISSLSATLKLLNPQLLDKTDDNNSQTNDIEVSSLDGFEHDVELIITTIPKESVELELTSNAKIIKVYQVNLVRKGEKVTLNESVTVKLLIPLEIKDESFRIYSNEKELSYTIQNGYAILTVDNLNEFTFVVDIVESNSILWLIILLLIILLSEISLGAYKIMQNKKDKKELNTYSFTPLILLLLIPTEQIVIAVILGSLCIIFAIFDILLFLPKTRGKKDENGKLDGEAILNPVLESVDFVASANIETKENTLMENVDENEEEKDVFKGIEEETGLAILVRYRKSFMAKLIQSPDETKNNYNELKNALLSYQKVKSNLSWNYDSIHLGRTKLAKFNIRGKSLYLYLPLNPDNYVNTKYKVQRTESKKYADLPCLYKIRNSRRAKFALELIDVIAKKFELGKDEEKRENYYLPYETTEALITKGLIKELVSKEKYEDWLNRQNKQELQSKKRIFVSASEVDSILNDEVAASLVVKKSVNLNQKKEKAIINMDTISGAFLDGELISLQSLHEKGLLAKKVNYFKILARGKLDKSLTMEANEFSIQAVKMILLTGGKVIKITQ